MQSIVITCLLTYFTACTLCAQVQKPDSNQKDIISLNEMRRIGAVCKDGARSQSTGVGTCSTHGGVDYWLYTEAPVYQQYSSNLPAIPSNQLLPMRPHEVKDLLELGKRLLPPPNAELNKRRQAIKPNARLDNDEATEPKSTPRKRTRSRWDVLDFLMPFVLFTVAVFMFVILYVIVKKVL